MLKDAPQLNQLRRDERKQQPAIRRQCVEPIRARTRSPRIDEDHIRRFQIDREAVAMYDLGHLQRREVFPRARCQFVVDFYRCHAATRSDRMREDGGVVPGPTSNVYRVLARLRIEPVQPRCEAAWVPVVEEAPRKYANHDIIVEVAWMSIGGRDVAGFSIAGNQELPWPGVQEVLPRNLRECA